ncbi:MAG: type II toxin-antitoxin system HicA family toxin [Bacteroidota bacterium]
MFFQQPMCCLVEDLQYGNILTKERYTKTLKILWLFLNFICNYFLVTYFCLPLFMTKIDKLLTRFLSIPKDLTWNELKKVLASLGFSEITKKGKTGGSRVKFANSENNVLNLHKPHPGNIVKVYMIKQIIVKLETWEIL